jgi:3D (Asp-Asp-Asp) domain-containing protein
VVVQKTEDMIVRQRRVVGVLAPVAQSRPVAYLEPAHDLPEAAAPGRAIPAMAGLAPSPVRRAWRPSASVLWLAAAVVTVATAITAKELGPVRPMAAIQQTPSRPIRPVAAPAAPAAAAPAVAMATLAGDAHTADTRWFNGRPVRPARTITMKVTAYSADAASCYPFADGQTATLHSVEANGGFLVAADTDLLPFGTMLSIAGYNDGKVVPVLDRGGAIKGNRLDLLFPSHEAALQWGVKTLDVVIWEYADGKPAIDPRKQRS